MTVIGPSVSQGDGYQSVSYRAPQHFRPFQRFAGSKLHIRIVQEFRRQFNVFLPR